MAKAPVMERPAWDERHMSWIQTAKQELREDRLEGGRVKSHKATWVLPRK